MKRKLYSGLAFLGILGMCMGVLGCGEPAEESISVPVETGEHMKFGTWQGEEIEWRVLDVKGGEVLLLSEYGLDVQPYNETQSYDIVWKDCTLRQWLNDDFYESAFTDEEREKILLSTSEGFPKYNSRVPGKDYDYLERETEDYVFLLSFTELFEYISNDIDKNMSDSKKVCFPTEYVKNNFDILSYQDTCGWWLCNGGLSVGNTYRPRVVTPYGSVDAESSADSMNYVVRPAIWIKW